MGLGKTLIKKLSLLGRKIKCSLNGKNDGTNEMVYQKRPDQYTQRRYRTNQLSVGVKNVHINNVDYNSLVSILNSEKLSMQVKMQKCYKLILSKNGAVDLAKGLSLLETWTNVYMSEKKDTKDLLTLESLIRARIDYRKRIKTDLHGTTIEFVSRNDYPRFIDYLNENQLGDSVELDGCLVTAKGTFYLDSLKKYESRIRIEDMAMSR